MALVCIKFAENIAAIYERMLAPNESYDRTHATVYEKTQYTKTES